MVQPNRKRFSIGQPTIYVSS